jgi:hypothetical protein
MSCVAHMYVHSYSAVPHSVRSTCAVAGRVLRDQRERDFYTCCKKSPAGVYRSRPATENLGTTKRAESLLTYRQVRIQEQNRTDRSFTALHRILQAERNLSPCRSRLWSVPFSDSARPGFRFSYQLPSLKDRTVAQIVPLTCIRART